ncbi:MAG: hypothetical protein ABSF45_28040 [Terriglobia bacterium]|jgi:hypothetical protein
MYRGATSNFADPRRAAKAPPGVLLLLLPGHRSPATSTQKSSAVPGFETALLLKIQQFDPLWLAHSPGEPQAT